MPRRRPDKAETRHALVGGWYQAKGRSVTLLLGVRQGRRRKLTYIGEAGTRTDDLMMRFLEERLRGTEVESSPFDDDVPDGANVAHHWVSPDLVAELDYDGWTGGQIKHASLRSVAERDSFRRPHWVDLRNRR